MSCGSSPIGSMPWTRGYPWAGGDTIRPQPEQRRITAKTAFTAGRATQADGTVRVAIFSLIDGAIIFAQE